MHRNTIIARKGYLGWIHIIIPPPSPPKPPPVSKAPRLNGGRNQFIPFGRKTFAIPGPFYPNNKRAGGCGGEGNNDVHHGTSEDAPFHGERREGASQADPSARTYYEDISSGFSLFSLVSLCLSEPRCLCFSFCALHSQNGYVKPATMEGLADISLDAAR